MDVYTRELWSSWEYWRRLDRKLASLDRIPGHTDEGSVARLYVVAFRIF